MQLAHRHYHLMVWIWFTAFVWKLYAYSVIHVCSSLITQKEIKIGHKVLNIPWSPFQMQIMDDSKTKVSVPTTIKIYPAYLFNT